MKVMTDQTDAELVIFGGRLKSGSVGYANDNGDFVPSNAPSFGTMSER
ncbi:hypothetical protein [Brevundimonas vancanneytii]